MLWIFATATASVITLCARVEGGPDHPTVAGCTVNHCAAAPQRHTFCYGPILHTAARFNQTWYLEAKLRFSPIQIMQSYDKDLSSNPTYEQVDNWFHSHFDNESSGGVRNFVPRDWTPHPTVFQTINNEKLRNFNYFLHRRWRNLTKRFHPSVEEHPELHGTIWVPHPFVVPNNARFMIYFYWDSFWIIKGLIWSEMTTTIEGILKNFAMLINTLGHIPNYGMVTASRRTQPPLFGPMIEEYLDAASPDQRPGRLTLISETLLPALEKEMDFWARNRSVNVGMSNDKGETIQHQMYAYIPPSNCPRPERYLADWTLANSTQDPERVYRSLTGACESGWDFSSRWFAQGNQKQNKEQTITQLHDALSTIETINVIPVDLNSFMCRNFKFLSEIHMRLGNVRKAEKYLRAKSDMINAIEAVLWNPDVGNWQDYDLIKRRFRGNDFYPSNFFPLWSDCYSDPATKLPKVLARWKDLNLNKYPGGIPVSTINTTEQWDFPNAWAPLVHLLVESFNQTNYAPLVEEGKKIALRWIRVNYQGYAKHGDMFEKYDVRREDGFPGGGGEYVVQSGFGWSNGAVQDLILRWGTDFDPTDTSLQLPHSFSTSNVSKFSKIIVSSNASVVIAASSLFAVIIILTQYQCLRRIWLNAKTFLVFHFYRRRSIIVTRRYDLMMDMVHDINSD